MAIPAKFVLTIYSLLSKRLKRLPRFGHLVHNIMLSMTILTVEVKGYHKMTTISMDNSSNII